MEVSFASRSFLGTSKFGTEDATILHLMAQGRKRVGDRSAREALTLLAALDLDTGSNVPISSVQVLLKLVLEHDMRASLHVAGDGTEGAHLFLVMILVHALDQLLARSLGAGNQFMSTKALVLLAVVL